MNQIETIFNWMTQLVFMNYAICTYSRIATSAFAASLLILILRCNIAEMFDVPEDLGGGRTCSNQSKEDALQLALGSSLEKMFGNNTKQMKNSELCPQPLTTCY